MRLLLDTHALIWWMESSPRLSKLASLAIAKHGDEVYVSAATAWEMATKFRLKKLDVAPGLMTNFIDEIEIVGFLQLSVTVAHGLRAGELEGENKDPFDRMLIAQAQIEELTLVSNEAGFDRFGIKRLW